MSKTIVDEDDETRLDKQQTISSGAVIDKIEKKRVVKKGARKVRVGEDIDDFINENISKVNKTPSKADEDLIMNCLRNHYVFYALTDDELEFVMQKMFYCENSHDFVFKQEDKASSYFIIEKGSVEIIINNEVTHKPTRLLLLERYLPPPASL